MAGKKTDASGKSASKLVGARAFFFFSEGTHSAFAHRFDNMIYLITRNCLHFDVV